MILTYTWLEASKKNMVSNAVATSALKLLPTPITTSWFIQTYWIRSLTPVDLIVLGQRYYLYLDKRGLAVISWSEGLLYQRAGRLC